MSIKIPPAALEAGARAFIEALDGNAWDAVPSAAQDRIMVQTRAAFLAMLTAWPGMIHGKYFAEPSIILPLTEQTDDKA